MGRLEATAGRCLGWSMQPRKCRSDRAAKLAKLTSRGEGRSALAVPIRQQENVAAASEGAEGSATKYLVLAQQAIAGTMLMTRYFYFQPQKLHYLSTTPRSLTKPSMHLKSTEVAGTYFAVAIQSLSRSTWLIFQRNHMIELLSITTERNMCIYLSSKVPLAVAECSEPAVDISVTTV